MHEAFLNRGIGNTRLKRLASKGVPRHVRSEVLLDACLACQLLEVAINERYLAQEAFLEKAAFKAFILADKDKGPIRSPFLAR